MGVSSSTGVKFIDSDEDRTPKKNPKIGGLRRKKTLIVKDRALDLHFEDLHSSNIKFSRSKTMMVTPRQMELDLKNQQYDKEVIHWN